MIMIIWRPSIFGICSTCPEFFEVGLDPFQLAHAEFLVRHFAAPEAQGHLDLVAFFQEARHVPQLDLVVVLVGARAAA